MKRFFIVILLLLSHLYTYAAHLVGGELSYRCLGGNSYEIQLIIYRDCQSNGAPFDDPAIITIYDGNNTFIQNRYVDLDSSRVLPITAPNNCTSLPSFVCTAEGKYIDTVFLPNNNSGYTLSHQRCCRNASIDNIPNPGLWGNTYTIEIPAGAACNSSPKFKNPPPVALCLNIATSIDMSVTESDADSLTYSLCYPYHGGGNQTTATGPNSPRPDTATPPPYTLVPFSAGYTANRPIPGNPAFSINPATGIMTGTPSQVGQYVFAVCVQEWRNGQYLSTLRRDFQFNVNNACRGTASDFQQQTTDPYELCSGRTMQFNELCFNASSYFWDFGVPNMTSDTSSQPNPSFTFPDTGSYLVTLIANPGSSCADTSQQLYYIYDDLDIDFEIGGQACFDAHSIDFLPKGNYSDSAKFFWNFGALTNRGSAASTEKSPFNVVYNQAGSYQVILEVEDGPCRDIHVDTVELFDRPVLLHDLSQASGCVPLLASFRDSSEYNGGPLVHLWDFGDGNTSNLPNPIHTYTKPGTYFVSHQIRSVSGCKDTLYEISDIPIEVHPTPTSNFSVSPAQTDIYNPNFQVQLLPLASNVQSWMLLPSGRRITPRNSEFIYTAQDTGYQKFFQITENEFGCRDTLLIETYVSSPFKLFVPNAFSPNGDGQNDEFAYSVLGTDDFQIIIYNRWGEEVFKSDDPQQFWQGTIQNGGNDAPGGVYTYQIRVRLKESGDSRFKRGYVNLIR